MSTRPSMLAPLLVLSLLGVAFTLPGCSTAPPRTEARGAKLEAEVARDWFLEHVYGLDRQLADSAGYVVFPDVGQVGVIYLGGQFGRGVVYDPSGRQTGWAAVNTGSLGLQAGVRGFRMLVVFENPHTLELFKQEKLSGDVTGVAVLGDEGTSGTAPFVHGAAVYQGDSTGVFAGVSLGLNYLRYEPR